eukprot:superscaffoldBa00001388_g10334
MADAVSTCESIFTKTAHPPCNLSPQPNSSDDPSPEDSPHISKPSLSYIALIAKVILSSPSQKLNLASIYRAMEEQFPYLKNRGPGWRNSVRHNLSVNDCFVKVSRCEDGRGHYWGVHQAHLRDFQQGNFRQYRKARGRREKEQYERFAGCLAWMETSCFLGRLCENGSESLGWVEPHLPLQEARRYQRSPLNLAETHYHPWSVSMGWADTSSWMRRYYFPERLPDSYGRAIAGRGHGSQSLTSRPHCWETHDLILKGMRESYDSRFMTPPLQLLSFPSTCAGMPESPLSPTAARQTPASSLISHTDNVAGESVANGDSCSEVSRGNWQSLHHKQVFLAMMAPQQMQQLLSPNQLQALIHQKQQALLLQQ